MRSELPRSKLPSVPSALRENLQESRKTIQRMLEERLDDHLEVKRRTTLTRAPGAFAAQRQAGLGGCF